jgi:TP901 family phage tail tape measure protein
MRAEYLELEVTADADQATRTLAAFKGEYGELVSDLATVARANKRVTRSSQEAARAANAQFKAARDQRRAVQELLKTATAKNRLSQAEVRAIRQSTRAYRGQSDALGIVARRYTGVYAGIQLVEGGIRVLTDAVLVQGRALQSSVETAAEYTQQLARVDAISGGGNFALFDEAALEQSQRTLFTAREAASALQFLSQAGLDAQKSVGALPGSLELAAAGNLDLARAADISTNILTGLNLEVKDLARVNDVLVSASTGANTNVEELGNAFSYTAGIASASNQTLEGTAAILAALANSGIKSTRAGRATANALSRLQKTTAEGQAVLKKYNVEVKNSDGSVRQLADVLRDLEAAGISNADVLRLFGEVAGRSLITVLNQGTGVLDRYTARFKAAEGTAREFNATVNDTASAQGRIFLSVMEANAITIGKRFLPVVKESAIALSGQGQELQKNNALFEQFDVLAEEGVDVLVALLDAGSLAIPVLARLGGGLIEVAQGLGVVTRAGRIYLRTLENGTLATRAFFNALTFDFSEAAQNIDDFTTNFEDNLEDIGVVLEDTNRLVDESGRAYAASAKIGDEFGEALAAASERVSGVNERLRTQPEIAFVAGQSLSTLSERYREMEEAIIASNRALATQYELTTSLTASGSAAVLEGFGNVVRQPRAPVVPDEGDTPPASSRARIDYITDAEIFHREQLLILNRELASASTRQEEARARAALKQLELDEKILANEEELARVKEEKQERFLKLLNDEFVAERVRIERELTDELEAIEQERAEESTRRQVAILRAQGKQREAIELETRSRIAQIRQNEELGARGRVEEEYLVNQARLTELAALERAEVEALQSARIESARLAGEAQAMRLIDLELAQQITQIRQSALTQEEQALRIRNAEMTATRELFEIEKQRARLVPDAVTQGAVQGFSVDTSSLSRDLLAERQSGIDELRANRDNVAARGGSTDFLDRRIEQLEQEFELEQRNQAQLQERLGVLSSVTESVGALTAQTFEYAASQKTAADAAKLTQSALSAVAGIGSELADVFIKDAKKRAKTQVFIESAAALANLALFATTGVPAFAQGAALHGASALKYGIVAGVAGASGAGGSGGGASGAGAGAARATRLDLEVERTKSAEAYARALRDQLEAPTSITYQISFDNATLLQSAPQIAREIRQASDQDTRRTLARSA